MDKTALPIRRGSIPHVVSRRSLLKRLGAILAPGTVLDYAQTPTVVTPSRRYGMMDAMEEHGQWASSPLWAQDIHKAMGAQVTALAVGTASGIDRAEIATELALQQVELVANPPDGAVVIVCCAPGPQTFRETYHAYLHVRDRLPLDAYCVYSPLASDMSPDKVTVNVALGWY
jgi:hypothetical protein